MVKAAEVQSMIQIDQAFLILALVPNLLVVLTLFGLLAGADAK